MCLDPELLYCTLHVVTVIRALIIPIGAILLTGTRGRVAPTNNSPLPNYRLTPLSANNLLTSTIMSHSHVAASSSSSFQFILNNAMDVYQERSGKYAHSHPFSRQLMACDSPASILIILQELAHALHVSRSTDGRFSKWVSVVSLRTMKLAESPRSALSYISHRQLRMFKFWKAEIQLSMSSSAMKVFYGVSTFTQKCRRPRK
jgi:hypothetical protein